MTNAEKILQALEVKVTPNMPVTAVDDAMLPSTDHLIYLIQKALADTVASSSVFRNYLQDMNQWYGAMIDVIKANDLHENQEILDEAFQLLRYAEEFHPITDLNDE